MRYFLLILSLMLLAGCEEPQTFEDTPDMPIRQTRNPPVLPHNPRGIPQVVSTIPREGLWSGYNQLGYQAKYGPDQRATQTILKLDEWGPPEVWTISLYVHQKLAVFAGFSIKARINFGAGGSSQELEMDWVNGAQISLPMNAVNVEAIFDDVDVTTEGAGLSLGVQLSRGARGGTLPPTLTLAQDTVIAANAAFISFPLPKFAKKAVFVPAVASAAAVAAFYSTTTRLFLVTGNTLGSETVAMILGDRSIAGHIELPVVGGARFVGVSNFDLLTQIEGTLFVELDG